MPASNAPASIPPMIVYAQNHGIDLPFSDVESLKASIADMIKDEFLFVGNFARTATAQVVFILIGIVVAVSLFLNPKMEKYSDKPKGSNLFTAVTDETPPWWDEGRLLGSAGHEPEDSP